MFCFRVINLSIRIRRLFYINETRVDVEGPTGINNRTRFFSFYEQIRARS